MDTSTTSKIHKRFIDLLIPLTSKGIKEHSLFHNIDQYVLKPNSDVMLAEYRGELYKILSKTTLASKHHSALGTTASNLW